MERVPGAHPRCHSRFCLQALGLRGRLSPRGGRGTRAAPKYRAGGAHIRLSHPGGSPGPGLPADPVLTRGPLSPGLPGRPASPCGTEGMKGVGGTGGTRGGQCPIRTLTHRGAFVTFLSTLALRRRSAAAAGGQKDKSPTSPPHNLPQIGAMAPPQCPPPKPPAPRTSLPRSPVCPGVPARPGSPFSPGSPGSP